MDNNEKYFVEQCKGMPAIYEEFLEALRGCDTIVFRCTGVGEKEYNTIFLVDIAKAVRKQIPKPPKMYVGEYEYERYPLCSNCGESLMPNGEKYCSECGQKIDWR